MIDWLDIPWKDLIVDTFALTLMLVGLFGLVLPIIPGLVIIWIAVLGYGIFAGFGTLGWIMFGLITVLMIAGSFADNILMGTRAHKEGASWISIILALIAAIAGNFLLPIIGGLLAALLVLFVAEWLRLKNWRKALTTMKGMAIGCGWAFVIRFIMGLMMIGLWMIWAWT